MKIKQPGKDLAGYFNKLKTLTCTIQSKIFVLAAQDMNFWNVLH